MVGELESSLAHFLPCERCHKGSIHRVGRRRKVGRIAPPTFVLLFFTWVIFVTPDARPQLLVRLGRWLVGGWGSGAVDKCEKGAETGAGKGAGGAVFLGEVVEGALEIRTFVLAGEFCDGCTQGANFGVGSGSDNSRAEEEAALLEEVRQPLRPPGGHKGGGREFWRLEEAECGDGGGLDVGCEGAEISVWVAGKFVVEKVGEGGELIRVGERLCVETDAFQLGSAVGTEGGHMARNHLVPLLRPHTCHLGVGCGECGLGEDVIYLGCGLFVDVGGFF